MALIYDRDLHEFVNVSEDWDGTKLLINGEFVDAYVSTYNSIGGHKAVLMSWDEELAMYTPWNTWFGAANSDMAWRDAKNWALSEEIPAVRNAA